MHTLLDPALSDALFLTTSDPYIRSVQFTLTSKPRLSDELWILKIHCGIPKERIRQAFSASDYLLVGFVRALITVVCFLCALVRFFHTYSPLSLSGYHRSPLVCKDDNLTPGLCTLLVCLRCSSLDYKPCPWFVGFFFAWPWWAIITPALLVITHESSDHVNTAGMHVASLLDEEPGTTHLTTLLQPTPH